MTGRPGLAAAAAVSSGAIGVTLVAGGTHAIAAGPAPGAADVQGSATASPSPTGVGQPVQPTFGTGKQIAMDLTVMPASIPADGKSTSTATADVTFSGSGGSGNYGCITITFASSDPSEKVVGPTLSGPATGPFTATVTASHKIETATITATCDTLDPTTGGETQLTAHAPLHQLAPTITLKVDPNTIPADGASTTTATATILTSAGHPETGDTVVFSSSDPGEHISAVTPKPDGTYSVTITASHAAETAAITATDTTVQAAQHASAPLTQTAVSPITVPSTGAGGAQPLLGALLLGGAGGLLGSAARLRRSPRAR